MSNALAIASVSFVLVDLLNNGLIDGDISDAIGDVMVTALPPDLVDAQQTAGKSQLNLFLYNVTQNAAWRNMEFPSRDSSGDRINNPPLALDLHYLLTAYGAEQYHSEILLGYGMQLLHETPFLARAAIDRSLAAPTQVVEGTTGLPAGLLNLYTSGLATQVEHIKIWPQTLTTEEISRLWTAFQAKYRSTAAYQCSVVLIQSTASTKKALPVQRRTVQAVPFAKPVITQILSLSNTNPPVQGTQPILPGYSLVIQGTDLQGIDGTTVQIGADQVAPASVTPTSVVVSIPADIPAGTLAVQIIQPLLLGSPAVNHNGFSSDPVAFTLQPVIQGILVTSGTSTTTGEATSLIRLTLNPPVGATQTVVLLLNQLPGTVAANTVPLAYSFPAETPYPLASPPAVPPGPSATVLVPYEGVTPGAYLVRVQVDGAESVLTQGANGIFNGPQVTL